MPWSGHRLKDSQANASAGHCSSRPDLDAACFRVQARDISPRLSGIPPGEPTWENNKSVDGMRRIRSRSRSPLGGRRTGDRPLPPQTLRRAAECQHLVRLQSDDASKAGREPERDTTGHALEHVSPNVVSTMASIASWVKNACEHQRGDREVGPGAGTRIDPSRTKRWIGTKQGRMVAGDSLVDKIFGG